MLITINVWQCLIVAFKTISCKLYCIHTNQTIAKQLPKSRNKKHCLSKKLRAQPSQQVLLKMFSEWQVGDCVFVRLNNHIMWPGSILQKNNSHHQTGLEPIYTISIFVLKTVILTRKSRIVSPSRIDHEDQNPFFLNKLTQQQLNQYKDALLCAKQHLQACPRRPVPILKHQEYSLEGPSSKITKKDTKKDKNGFNQMRKLIKAELGYLKDDDEINFEAWKMTQRLQINHKEVNHVQEYFTTKQGKKTIKGKGLYETQQESTIISECSFDQDEIQTSEDYNSAFLHDTKAAEPTVTVTRTNPFIRKLPLRPITKMRRRLYAHEKQIIKCCLNYRYALEKLSIDRKLLSPFVLAKIVEDILQMYHQIWFRKDKERTPFDSNAASELLREIFEEELIGDFEIQKSTIIRDCLLFLRQVQKNQKYVRESKAEWLVKEYAYLKGWVEIWVHKGLINKEKVLITNPVRVEFVNNKQ